MWLWAAFIIFVLSLLVLDLGVFHRKAHVITLKEALTWSGVWIGVALVYTVFVYLAYEYDWCGLDIPEDEPDARSAPALFFTGYTVAKPLGSATATGIASIASCSGFSATCDCW